MSDPIVINYGPACGPTKRAILGEGARNINNCIYETPHWEAWLRADGTVVQFIERAASDLVYTYADRGEWYDAMNARLATVRDPETGRSR